MTAPSLLDHLRAARVVPVVRTREARHAATAVQWLYAAYLAAGAAFVGMGGALVDETRIAAGDRAAIQAAAHQMTAAP